MPLEGFFSVPDTTGQRNKSIACAMHMRCCAPKAPVDANNPKSLLHDFAEKNGLDTVQVLAYARQYYPQKTLLHLVDVLVEK